MATGRKYIEKMVEGISNLDQSGDLKVSGTLLYKRKNINMLVDTTVTEAQSGGLMTFKGSGITASLPQSTTANEGICYTFSNGVLAATANLFITASSGGQIVGGIGANLAGAEGAYAGLTTAIYGLKGSLSAIGDQIEITSMSGVWVITNSNVSGSTWEVKAAGAS